jgi:3,4-dihydroxy 2-butanone 4-phosphate synthase/GTP cyclohydrolase II
MTGRQAAVDIAIAQIRAGRPVVVIDDEDRENEGDLIFAAEFASPQLMAFTVRHGSGFVCVALSQQDCDRLALPPMHHCNADQFGTAYCVAVDASDGVTTGISAHDRAHTARVLADPAARSVDLVRPGHLVPLAARPGGVLERPGHTEAALDLTRLAGLRPAGVLCELVSARVPGQMARREELLEFCATHDLQLISIAQLVAHRRSVEPQVEQVVSTRLPTAAGPFRTVGYRAVDGTEHIALVAGAHSHGDDVPVHLHGECLLGDVFGSRRCSCAHRLDAAMREITARGRGVVVYLRPAAHSNLVTLQDHAAGVERISASWADCAPTDDNRIALHILRDLGVTSVEHLHTAPSLQPALADLGPAVAADLSLPSSVVA